MTISPESQLARTAHQSPVVVFAGIEDSGGRVRRLEDLGVNVIVTPAAGDGLNLDAVLGELKRRGIRGVLVEGGGETAARFIKKGLVDKLTVFYAPKIIGAEGVPMIGKLRLTRMADAAGFTVSNTELIDGDLAVTFYPAEAVEEEHVYRAG